MLKRRIKAIGNDGKRDGIGNQSRCIKEKQPAEPIIMVRARVYNNKRKKF